MNPEELCTLIETHFSTLLLYARQWGKDCAEDVVQDAFLRLVKRSHWEGRPEQPVAWLFQVVRNGAIDRVRKEQTRQKHAENLAAENPVRFEMPPEAAIQAEEIEKMLELLSQDQRAILIERIWGGLTFEEIATLRRTSRTTVFRTYTDALETIRRKYGNEKNR